MISNGDAEFFLNFVQNLSHGKEKKREEKREREMNECILSYNHAHNVACIYLCIVIFLILNSFFQFINVFSEYIRKKKTNLRQLMKNKPNCM